MKMSGTLINYYCCCKRKCYLFSQQLGMEYGNELVEMGKALHEEKMNDSCEISFSGFVVDELTDEYVIEKKKTHANTDGAKWQLLYYLYELKQRGLVRKGCLWFLDDDVQEIYELSDEIEQELLQMESDVVALINSDKIPDVIDWAGCKKCAYYEYCYC